MVGNWPVSGCYFQLWVCTHVLCCCSGVPLDFLCIVRWIFLLLMLSVQQAWHCRPVLSILLPLWSCESKQAPWVCMSGRPDLLCSWTHFFHVWHWAALLRSLISYSSTCVSSYHSPCGTSWSKLRTPLLWPPLMLVILVWLSEHFFIPSLQTTFQPTLEFIASSNQSLSSTPMSFKSLWITPLHLHLGHS